jgi:hypothetical protein
MLDTEYSVERYGVLCMKEQHSTKSLDDEKYTSNSTTNFISSPLPSGARANQQWVSKLYQERITTRSHTQMSAQEVEF